MLLISVTIASLTGGQTFKCNDIDEIQGYEAAIKSSCASLYEKVETMRTFGGEEVIEYTRDGPKGRLNNNYSL